MSINRSEAMKARLEAMKKMKRNRGNEGEIEYFNFKEAGKYNVRILPSKNPEQLPFKEVWTHYGLIDKKSFRCPLNTPDINKPCPICEEVERLESSADSQDRDLARDLSPTLRVYCNVIELDSEGKQKGGVKVWGMYENTYMDILAFYDNAMWGDIIDPREGRNLFIERVPKPGTTFKTTKIMLWPNATPVAESEEDLKKLLDSTVNLDNYAKEKESYRELKNVLEFGTPNPEGVNTPAGDQKVSTPETKAVPAVDVTPSETSAVEVAQAVEKTATPKGAPECYGGQLQTKKYDGLDPDCLICDFNADCEKATK